MRKYFAIVLLLITLFPAILVADEIDDITKAFSNGNATLLFKHFKDNVELNVNNNNEIYSSSQAKLIMENFFSENTPTSYELMHQGGGESSTFSIGNLKTASKNFRVSVYLKTIDGKLQIHQIRIQNEK